MEAGYEGFSMGLLSKRAGVAKGTLYLYFGTKEEVLLSLYSQEFERFCNNIAVGISPSISDADFVSHLYETSLSRPDFPGAARQTGYRNRAEYFSRRVDNL